MRLREIRTKNHISQEKLAKALNVSRTTITNYEIGISKPDIEMIKRIANFFNVSIDYLLDNEVISENEKISEQLKQSRGNFMANKIKVFRKKYNFSQQQLAKLVGYEQSIVSMWEKGTREPGNQTLIRLAEIFNCSVDELVGREFTQKKEPAVIEPRQEKYSEEIQECLELVKQLSNTQALKVSGYIEKMLEEKEFMGKSILRGDEK